MIDMRLQNNFWNKLSLTIKIITFLVTLTFSTGIIIVKFWIPVLAFFSLLFLGAYSISRKHFVYFLAILYMLVIIGYVLPLEEGGAGPFVYIYLLPYFSLLFIATLIAIQGIKIEEWLWILRKFPSFVRILLIGLSTGYNSIKKAIKKNSEVLTMTKPNKWLLIDKNKFFSSIVNSYEFKYFTAITMALDLDSILSQWAKAFKHTKNIPYNLYPLKLNDIYDLNGFPDIYEDLFDTRKIVSGWDILLRKYVKKTMSVIDIGAGMGRVSMFLADKCAHVDALESNKKLTKKFKKKHKVDNSGNIRIIEDSFPLSHADQLYDVAILHQNVMLELINEYDIKEIWGALKKIVTRGGYIIFDYFDNFELPETETENILVKKSIKSLGNVVYSYKYVCQKNNWHEISIILQYSNEHLQYNNHCKMEVKLPQKSELFKDANMFNFQCIDEIKLDNFTFFPGTMKAFVFRILE